MMKKKQVIKKRGGGMMAKNKQVIKKRGGGMMKMNKGGMTANTSRMNKLEELGRVDSEKAFTSKGKKNLSSEKKRIIRGLKK